MFTYPVFCYTSDCGQPAEYKIAARWSDGTTEELKTYALCCATHLPDWLQRSREKQQTCRKAAHEKLDPAGAYRIEHGRRDRQLQRLPDPESSPESSAEPREG